MSSNLVCNHTSDKKIGQPRSRRPICFSRVWLQTELNDTTPSYQLIIKITISEKRRAQLWKKGEICTKKLTRRRKLFNVALKERKSQLSRSDTVSMVIETKVVIGWFNYYNFGCDWLVELSAKRLSDNSLASELVEKRSIETNHHRGNCNFYDQINDG